MFILKKPPRDTRGVPDVDDYSRSVPGSVPPVTNSSVLCWSESLITRPFLWFCLILIPRVVVSLSGGSVGILPLPLPLFEIKIVLYANDCLFRRHNHSRLPRKITSGTSIPTSGSPFLVHPVFSGLNKGLPRRLQPSVTNFWSREGTVIKGTNSTVDGWKVSRCLDETVRFQ